MAGRVGTNTENESWARALAEALAGAPRTVVLGIGNVERGDDGAGVRFALELSRRTPPVPPGRALVLAAGPAPENFTGVVRSFAPELVVIVDSAMMGRPPGTIAVVPPDAVAGGDVSTHRIPLTLLQRYLETELECRVIILGIEPKSFETGPSLSRPVRRAVRSLAAFIAPRLA